MNIGSISLDHLEMNSVGSLQKSLEKWKITNILVHCPTSYLRRLIRGRLVPFSIPFNQREASS